MDLNLFLYKSGINCEEEKNLEIFNTIKNNNTYLLSRNTFCKYIFEEKLGYNNFIWPRLEQEKKVVGKKRLTHILTQPGLANI